MLQDSSYPLYVDSFPNTRNIRPQLNRHFLEATALPTEFKPDWLDTGFFFRMGYNYYLKDIFKGVDLSNLPAEALPTELSPTDKFRMEEIKMKCWISHFGLYMNESHYNTIKKKLHPVLQQYFMDEFCFLISYFSWLVNREKKVDYAGWITTLEKFQIEIEEKNKNIENIKLAVSKIRADKENMNLAEQLIQNLEKEPDPIMYERRGGRGMRKIPLEQIIEERKKEIRTTSKENKSIFLLRQHLFQIFYHYLFKEVNPWYAGEGNFWKPTSMIGKYSLINNISIRQAGQDVLKKKLYLKSAGEIYFEIGKIFVLLGLLQKDKDKNELIDMVKKIHLRFAQKYGEADKTSLITRAIPRVMEIDGTLKPMYTKKEWEQIRKRALERNTVQYQIDHIKELIIRDSKWLDEQPYVSKNNFNF